MNAKVVNLTLLIFWLVLGIGLWTRDLWMPPGLLDKVSGPQTPLVIALCGVLAVWNLMRYWTARRFGVPHTPSAAVQEYRRRIRSITGEDPKVVNPEFNFDEPPADDSRRNNQ
jgi:hypothetical protein